MQGACILAEDGRAILLEQEKFEKSTRISKACDAFLKSAENFQRAFKYDFDFLTSSDSTVQAVAQCKLHATSLHRHVLECKEELRIEQSNAKAQLMHKQHELDRLERREKEVLRDLREQAQHLESILQLQGSRGLNAT
ncbi:hypothetical protein COCOBI_06-4870 [Coccomyxa sp. Obi]|nr:hypothetical protein COCOBI_06-4870 [Coccomyxa sp. Obi]